MKDIVTYSSCENQLYEDIRAIIEEARANAVRSVDFNRVLMYWKTGPVSLKRNRKGRIVPTTARISLNVWLSALSPATAADSPRGSCTLVCSSTGPTRK